MFWTVERYQQDCNEYMLDSMYRLRAKVFHEEMGWSVSVSGGREIDGYDMCDPVYLLWTDAEKRVLFGSLRLLPTTGPTLLYDVFRKTFADDVCLAAPGIWEGTRLCVDEHALARHLPAIDRKRAFCLMLLALCETALKHHIQTLVSNFEPPTKRLYHAAGAPLSFLGSADGFGKRPVCAGTFAVSIETRDRMRAAQCIRQSLLLPDINAYLGTRLRAAA